MFEAVGGHCEILQIGQLYRHAILIDQKGMLVYKGISIYAYQICNFDQLVMFCC